MLWDSSAAGHVGADEDYDVAANRELGEELGVAVALTRVAKLPASEKTGQEFIWLYQARHDGPFELAHSEIEHGEFFPTDIVSDWLKARPTLLHTDSARRRTAVFVGEPRRTKQPFGCAECRREAVREIRIISRLRCRI